LAYWFWAIRERSKVQPAKREKLDVEYRSNVPQKLVVWGSEPFLKKHGAWFHSKETEGTMAGFEEILYTIRTDLGYTNKGLAKRAPVSGSQSEIRRRPPQDWI
jgi:hypothetical protein